MPSVTQTVTIRWTNNTTGVVISVGYIGAIKVKDNEEANDWATDTHYKLSYVGDGKYQRSTWEGGAGFYDLYKDTAGVEANATFWRTIYVNPKRKVRPEDVEFMEDV